MGYLGRSNRGLDSHNFGGINTRNGLVNVAENEALDITNFDIAPDGAITRRKGFTQISSTFQNPQSIIAYFRYDTGFAGTEWFSIISNGKFWEASDPYGVWTDRTGSVVFTTAHTVAVGYRGKIFAANGVDQPVYQLAGNTAITLRDASIILPPTALNAVATGTPPAGAITYYIASVSGRGITNPESASLTKTSGLTNTSTDYWTLSWVPAVGAVAQNIYKTATSTHINSGDILYQIVTTVDPGVATLADNGAYSVTNLDARLTTAGTNTYKYIVTSTVGGIEQECAYGTFFNLSGVDHTAGPQYITVQDVIGATLYSLYVYMAAGTYTGERADNFNGGISVTIPTSGFYLIRTSTTTSLVDFGTVGTAHRGSLTTPLTEWKKAPVIHPAYNTPKDWDDNGQPEGFAVLAGSKAERLLAWRKESIWASALQNGLDWYSPNDAFEFSITGGGDRAITSIGTLVDYTIAFTRNQSFVYTGTIATEVNQVKILPIGCTGVRSMFSVDTDLWFWGQYGPTSFKRVFMGQDIEPNTGLSAKVNSLVYASNRTQWPNLVGYFDVPNNKAVWCFATTNSSSNDSCLVYNTLTESWTKYSGWSLASVAISQDARIFALTTAGALIQLGIGNTDNGSLITATYNTGWFDVGDWSKRKRLVWVDFIGDRQGGPYSFSVNASFDYGLHTDSPINCTETTTDGVTIETTSSNATIHRIYIDGFGESFQLQISTSAGDTPVRILGWQPDTRAKGIRGNG